MSLLESGIQSLNMNKNDYSTLVTLVLNVEFMRKSVSLSITRVSRIENFAGIISPLDWKDITRY